MTTKITISGTAPKFDEAVLKQLQADRHNVYHSTDESYARVRGSIPYEFLTSVIDHHTKGYSITTKYPFSMDAMNYHCRMLKPKNVQLAELQAIDATVKQEYIDKLEVERQKYRELLTAQLLQTAEAKEAKRIADKQAKLLSEIQREVDDVFGELVIPD